MAVFLQLGPGNESCRDSILRSDRLMLVFELFSAVKRLWTESDCERECLRDSSIMMEFRLPFI